MRLNLIAAALWLGISLIPGGPGWLNHIVAPCVAAVFAFLAGTATTDT